MNFLPLIEARRDGLPLTDAESRSFVRFFYSGANKARLDNQSRVSIPQTLRSFAQLEGDVIVDSILDWTDEDDLHQLNGAEDDYYSKLEPPYRAKNGPLDRIEELLLVRGVTKELFEGTPAVESEPGRAGLRELLTTTSNGKVNVNTASAPVLQTIFGLDDTQVAAILARRDGQDGAPGTEDDQPFRSAGDFVPLLGTHDAKLNNFVTVQSEFFRVESTGQWGGVKHTISVVLHRQGGNCYVVSWNEPRGGS